MIRGAMTARTALATIPTATVAPSKADATSARSSLRTRSGTTAALRAPPATSTKIMLGAVFAVLYASLVDETPSDAASAMVRRKPVARLRAVPAAIPAAAGNRRCTGGSAVEREVEVVLVNGVRERGTPADAVEVPWRSELGRGHGLDELLDERMEGTSCVALGDHRLTIHRPHIHAAPDGVVADGGCAADTQDRKSGV